MASVLQRGPVFLHQLHIGHGKVLFSFIFSWKEHCEIRKEKDTGATQLRPSSCLRSPAGMPFGWLLTFQG